MEAMMTNALNSDFSVPNFDNSFIQKWTPYIKTMVTNSIPEEQWNDNSYEIDDIVNECLMHLYKACENYKNDRKMKFSTYAIMVLRSRISSFKMKMNRKKRRMVSTMQSVPGAYGAGENQFDEEAKSVSPDVEKRVTDLAGRTEAVDKIHDINMMRSMLEQSERLVFDEIYIQGFTLNQFIKKHKFSFYKTRNIKRNVDTIFKTFVELENPLIQ